MKAKFIGDPTQPEEKVPDTLEHLGLTFDKGKFTDIPPEQEEKFVGNNHFEVQGKETPEDKK